MTKQIVITIEFESDVDCDELKENARDIMSDLLSSYYITGVKYELVGCDEN